MAVFCTIQGYASQTTWKNGYQPTVCQRWTVRTGRPPARTIPPFERVVYNITDIHIKNKVKPTTAVYGWNDVIETVPTYLEAQHPFPRLSPPDGIITEWIIYPRKVVTLSYFEISGDTDHTQTKQVLYYTRIQRKHWAYWNRMSHFCSQC